MPGTAALQNWKVAISDGESPRGEKKKKKTTTNSELKGCLFELPLMKKNTIQTTLFYSFDSWGSTTHVIFVSHNRCGVTVTPRRKHCAFYLPVPTNPNHRPARCRIFAFPWGRDPSCQSLLPFMILFWEIRKEMVTKFCNFSSTRGRRFPVCRDTGTGYLVSRPDKSQHPKHTGPTDIPGAPIFQYIY